MRLILDYEALQPRLQALLVAQEEDRKLAASLEERIAILVDGHATHVRGMPCCFCVRLTFCRWMHCPSCL